MWCDDDDDDCFLADIVAMVLLKMLVFLLRMILMTHIDVDDLWQADLVTVTDVKLTMVRRGYLMKDKDG